MPVPEGCFLQCESDCLGFDGAHAAGCPLVRKRRRIAYGESRSALFDLDKLAADIRAAYDAYSPETLLLQQCVLIRISFTSPPVRTLYTPCNTS